MSRSSTIICGAWPRCGRKTKRSVRELTSAERVKTGRKLVPSPPLTRQYIQYILYITGDARVTHTRKETTMTFQELPEWYPGKAEALAIITEIGQALSNEDEMQLMLKGHLRNLYKWIKDGKGNATSLWAQKYWALEQAHDLLTRPRKPMGISPLAKDGPYNPFK